MFETSVVDLDQNPKARSISSVTLDLRILATSDLHMHLCPYDYVADRASCAKGLALTATLIEEARNEAANALLFDNGDFLQGGPMGDVASAARLSPHPAIAAMNVLRYDAANTGNHEYSFGLEYLRHALKDAEFPCLSTNYSLVRGDTWPLSRSVIITKTVQARDGSTHKLNVGVVGILPEQFATGEATNESSEDVMETLRCTIPALRQGGADVIVVLAHCGVESEASGKAAATSGVSIAQLPGVDAIVLGHVHLVFPDNTRRSSADVDHETGLIAGVPAVMPGFHGSHLGVIDLVLQKDRNEWKRIEAKSSVRAVARRGSDGMLHPVVLPAPKIVSTLHCAHETTRAWASEVVGTSAININSYFSMVSDGPLVRLVQVAQRRFIEENADLGHWAHLPLLSAASPFKAGGRGGPENYVDVSKGQICNRHLADIYEHPNTVSALLLSGAEVRKWLELSTSVFGAYQPTANIQNLINPNVPYFNFDTIHGLTYRIDLSVPYGDDGAGRVKQLMWKGQPVHDGQHFVLVTNGFRASERLASMGLSEQRILLSSDIRTRDVVIDYLQDVEFKCKPFAKSWKFVPIPGAAFSFRTSPNALCHMDELQDVHLEPMHIDEEGFLVLRLLL